ncbi:ABC transporter ATP-binding protein [Haliscomenobacter sp.]|uniref:ABC transporter ATP-binding protein n=1 Tax=Haliscomenobacter sp. TaxID=2717303 RepID=UPI003593AC19
MKSFWRLLSFLHKYRANVALSILSNLLMAVFNVASIPLLIPLLDIIFQKNVQALPEPVWSWTADGLRAQLNYQVNHLIQTQGQEAALIRICAVILLVFLGKNLFNYLAMFFMAPARNGIVRDIRAQLFSKIMILPLGYFSEERKGDLMSRITADVQEIEWSILNALESLFREPIIIVLSLIFMLYVSPTLTGFVFVLMLFSAVIIGGIGRTLRKSSSKVQERLGTIVSIVEEAISGLRIIKGFNAEKYQENKFNRENNDYRRMQTRMLWRRDLASPLSEFLGIAVVSVLLWFGARMVFKGSIEASTFISFLYAFFSVLNPAKAFSRGLYDVQRGIAAMQRVEHILNAPVLIEEKTDAPAFSQFKKSIEYRNVSFNYRGDEPVLKNINLNIHKGKLIALVGASGAGKSTMADLLPRFYDVSDGGIFIDGINIKDISLRDLRQQLGIVSQEAILFNDTIYNNIVFGMENITPEDVERAAKIANAHNFIITTENGYQTNIGDRGSKLSGGQRQRLTIARAVLKNPPILILDEATSALDSESEKLVQEALLNLMKDRTSLVIAHRLSTVQHADEIIVMRAGQIAERGSHAELLEKNGEYRKLVELQAMS